MQALKLPFNALASLALLIVVSLVAPLAGGAPGAGLLAAPLPQAKKEQKPAEKKEPEKKEEKKEEKKGGLFGGFKRATGMEKGEETRATASAGAKGAQPGSGKGVASHSPTSTDRSKVATMEGSKPSDTEMAAFFKEGKLTPKVSKGGS